MIYALLVNMFLAVVYMALVGDNSYISFVTGLISGYIVLSIYFRSVNKPNHGYKLFKLCRFTCYFFRILVKANWQVAVEVITPGYSQKPRILRYPVAGWSEVEITVLSNCITLTPGTLVMDVSDDANWLYIHCMYAEDPRATFAELDELAMKLRKEVFS